MLFINIDRLFDIVGMEFWIDMIDGNSNVFN